MQPTGSSLRTTWPARFNPLRGNQTLRRWRGRNPRPWAPGFNPLRGRQTLRRQTLLQLIKRLLVSILYEADRLCNPGPTSPPGGAGTCFNPLRGRQTLRPMGMASLARALTLSFNPLRGRQTLRRLAPALGPVGQRRFNPLRGRQTLQPPG